MAETESSTTPPVTSDEATPIVEPKSAADTGPASAGAGGGDNGNGGGGDGGGSAASGGTIRVTLLELRWKTSSAEILVRTTMQSPALALKNDRFVLSNLCSLERGWAGHL